MTTAQQEYSISLFSSHDSADNRIRLLDAYATAARNLEFELDGLTNAQLSEHVKQLRQDVSVDQQDQIVENYICAAAFAAQSIHRILGFRMHDVQLTGALAAASGAIIEMQTGEGKTIVCGVAAFIRSIFDRSVHVATTNDYLAERDHEVMVPVYQLLNTSSAVIKLGARPDDTIAAYRCNITYGPGYLFGFDYLRDQIKLRDEESLILGRQVLQVINGRDLSAELAQYAHHSIIVDEADSVLIDESTTPLILSGGRDQSITEEVSEGYTKSQQVAEKLNENEHYTVDSTERQIELTDEGMELIHEVLNNLGRMDLRNPWPVYIKNSLFARHLLLRDEHYVVDEGQIKLVDQNTGRIFEDRTLRGGLHQAVEAKEGVEINPPNRTMARVTRQRFFQLYDVVCGMTGTAAGSERELEYFYRSPVVPLPPNEPCQRIELGERFFKDWESKLRAITADVAARVSKGQPILIGTRTIRESVMVQKSLTSAGINPTVLNGVQDADEADIIARAGQIGAITIATNMAGRGTDIKLSRQSRELGGLHVICSQRHCSRRVDRQLAGRCARQGDPGSVQFFISADDNLLEKYGQSLADRIRRAAGADGEACADFSGDVERLQQKIERQQFELRRRLVRQDGWMDQIRESMVRD